MIMHTLLETKIMRSHYAIAPATVPAMPPISSHPVSKIKGILRIIWHARAGGTDDTDLE